MPDYDMDKVLGPEGVMVVRAAMLRQMYDDAWDFRDWQTIDYVSEVLDRDPQLAAAFRSLDPEDEDDA